MFGTLMLSTRAETEMCATCFALVIILKFYPCTGTEYKICPSGVGFKVRTAR